MNLLRAALLLATLVLAGCETSGGHLLTYAADGTVIQAERLVARIQGNPAKPLPYSGPDIDRPLARMQARWPQLKAELAAGRLGLTDTGYIGIRESGPQALELRKLVRAENLDRQVLYRGMGDAVGHGGENVMLWMPYTEDVFANEWIRQAPAGWWFLNAEQVWQRKTAEPASK
jgi:hypothetical protein